MRTLKTRLFIGTLAVIMALGNFHCKKKVDFKLPAATTSGANTFGFVVDDYVWTPFMECRVLQSNCLAQMAYVTPTHLEFTFGRRYRDKESSLYISSPLNVTISSVGEKIDSIGIGFHSEWATPTAGVFTGPLPGSKFTITRYDPTAKIISGEFHFILADQNNTIIELKNGRFDFSYPACHCD